MTWAAMRIFVLQTKEDRGCDEYNGFVVAARTQMEARTLAYRACAIELYEGQYYTDSYRDYVRRENDVYRSVWFDTDPGRLRVEDVGEYTGTESEPNVILSNFHVG